MIRKSAMKLGKFLAMLLIISMILFVLCMACGLLYEDQENRTLFFSLGGGGLVVATVVWIAFKLRNRSKYQKLCDKVGEYGIQKLEEDYKKGERKNVVVFGDTHLFVEPNGNILGFDVIEYRQILWMYLYQHTTNYKFIPVLSIWYIRIYLDEPARGRQQIVDVNARRFRKNPTEFFNRVVTKNPNILLEYNHDWDRMYHKDKETFIRFARSQRQVLR